MKPNSIDMSINQEFINKKKQLWWEKGGSSFK